MKLRQLSEDVAFARNRSKYEHLLDDLSQNNSFKFHIDWTTMKLSGTSIEIPLQWDYCPFMLSGFSRVALDPDNTGAMKLRALPNLHECRLSVCLSGYRGVDVQSGNLSQFNHNFGRSVERLWMPEIITDYSNAHKSSLINTSIAHMVIFDEGEISNILSLKQCKINKLSIMRSSGSVDFMMSKYGDVFQFQEALIDAGLTNLARR